ncbi:MAG: hypothetical protein HFG97_07900 [Dorea sp.]|nr:hypothetical protein [Dorea sp.]
MDKKAVIFGAGEWGRIAYYYYKEDIEIAYYIDNDDTIWNTKVNGITVCSPEILKRQKYTVIIANKRFEAEIKEQLIGIYNIREAIVFRIDESMLELCLQQDSKCKEDELIVSFSHGLGNQMFQYALYRNFLKQGKNVKADLSAYIKPGMMPFKLLEVFPNIKLEYCNPKKKEDYLKERKEKVYIEEPPRGKVKETYKKKLLEMECGYIIGFHCSYKYPALIRKELLEDFSFSEKSDDKLCEIKQILRDRETVGVHVRRGDFLDTKYLREMGTCTKEYYLNAIDYMRQKKPNAVFCFFSDDIEWVKHNIKEDYALYIEKNMFIQYYDWYDMYLMSICKHNIIPNSTFGWWGAWLNQNPEKIVIAPSKWRKRWEAIDWCPLDWFLM